MQFDKQFIKNILGQLPANIFLKDKNCRYIFASHYWRHIKHGDQGDWDISGKTDLDIRVNKSNAILAYNEDKKIIESGKGCSYVIEETIDDVTEYLEITKCPVFDDDGSVVGIIGLIKDITEYISDKQTINEFISYDIITGLYNRKGFLENIYKVFINNKNKMALIILIYCDFGDDSLIAYNNTLYLANSIRVPLTSDKVCARIENNIFSVALSLSDDESPQLRVDRFITDVNQSRNAFTNYIPDFVHPKIINLWTTINFNSNDEVEEALEKLLFELKSKIISEPNTQSTYESKLIKLRDMMYKYPEKDWNISDIVKDLALSKSHFFRIYKKMFMTSCAQDIIESRVKKATGLLIYTDLNISEISRRCGYKSENHFAHQFRDIIGMTASAYRDKNKYTKGSDV